MRTRLFSGLAVALAVGLLASWSAPLAGQAPARAAAAAKAPVNPRTPDGHPDLQGVYDLATLTPVERPPQFGNNLTLTPQLAKQLETQQAQRRDQAALPSRGDRNAPPIGGDGSTGAAGNVGGYNNFWIDSGESYVIVNGEKRTSIIVDPPNGRVPQTTAAARQRQAARPNGPTSDQQEGTDPGLERAPGAYDDPERRPLGERCLLGFGSTSGPPALPVLYNNLHQIVQTKDNIMILNEMDHDARIVRMNQSHLPSNVRKWLGDSVGHWDRNTLVIDTTNFTDQTPFPGAQNLHVVERLTRVDSDTILYQFTVEDPGMWTKPWSGEVPIKKIDGQIYEYACNEANYGLANTLRGARVAEAQAAK
ncbi:MAG TPA: hypothetical protein VKE94_19430 [Gemmataceae bacterium]|nr:hypothetical protein [Gemmataceae bacterium]